MARPPTNKVRRWFASLNPAAFLSFTPSMAFQEFRGLCPPGRAPRAWSLWAKLSGVLMCATAGLVSCKANLAAPATTAPAVVPGAPIATPSELAAAPGATAAPATNATATSDESRDEECTEGCDSSEIDDEGGSSAQAATTARPVRSPLDGWSQSQIESELVAHPEKLGSMSIGNTNAGALFNGVQMPKGDRWEVVDPNHAWGTRETVDYLVHCLNEVEQR